MRKILIFTIMMLCLSYPAKGDERTFKAELSSKNTAPGRQVEMSLVFSGTKDIPPPELPFMPDISFKYKDKIFDVAGNTLTYKFSVIPTRPGSYSIGPLITVYDGETLISNQVELKVDKIFRPKDLTGDNNLEVNNNFDLSKHIFAKIEIPGGDVYMNEKAIIKLEVYSDWLDIEDLKIAESFKMKKLISSNFKKNKSFISEIKGVKYIVIDYIKEFFSPFPGSFSPKPFKVMFNIVMPEVENEGEMMFLNDNMSFYKKYMGRKKEKSEIIEVDPGKIKIMDLPPGKPFGFKGAVGNFNVEIEPARQDSYTEEGIYEFTTTIMGEGNYDTVSAPVFASDKGLKIYPEARRRKEKSVTFEQKVKPVDKSLKYIPALRFVFFSPEERKYKVIEKGPFEISPGISSKDKTKSVRVSGGSSEEGKSQWISSLKKDMGRIYDRKYGMISMEFAAYVLVLIVLMFLSGLYRYRSYWIKTSDDPKAIAKRAGIIGKNVLSRARYLSKKRKSEEFCETVFRGMQKYFAELMGLSPGNITESAVKGFLKDNFQLEALSEGINEVFSYCYRGKFSDAGMDKEEMENALKNTERLFNIFDDISLDLIMAAKKERE